MTGLEDDYEAARLLYSRLGDMDAGRGPYIWSSVFVAENGERRIFLGS